MGEGLRRRLAQEAQREVQDFCPDPADRFAGKELLGRSRGLTQSRAHFAAQIHGEEGTDLAQGVGPPARNASIAG